MDTLDLGTLYGDPLHAADYEQMQTQNLDCVEMSADDMIAQVTGQDVSEADITARAEQLQSAFDTDPGTGQATALYDPNTGTDFRDLPTLLAAYGVHGEYTDDSTAMYGGNPTGIDALASQLSAGHQVSVSVDADTIWNALGLQAQPDGGQPDHAVVVTGVDTTTGTVYLNDSGTPNGAGEAVPIDVFEQAWASSGHAMVTTDGSLSTSTPDPLDAPGPAWGTPDTNVSGDPFGTYHESPISAPADDPFAFGQLAGATNDDSTLIVAGISGVAAAAAATMLHPRARTAVAATTRSAIARARARSRTAEAPSD